MRRLGLALLLVASGALAAPGDTRVSVTLKPEVMDAHAAGEELVAIYGGRLIEASAQTVVMEISVARSGLVARDPRVASVTVLGSRPPGAAAPAHRPLQPRPTADDPCTTAPIGLPRCTGLYQYDGSGNIKAIGNDVFRYDAVGRLKKATLASAGGAGEDYAYDAFGNLNNITAANGDIRPTLTPEPATNHLRNTDATVTYDEAGNLKSWQGHAYTYDAANMLTELNVGIADYLYAYTADDERIATLAVSNSGYVATWRIRGQDNKVLRELQEESYAASTQPWSWKRDYVYRGDLLLASYATSPAGTIRRLDYHLDHLGTPRLITDDAGQQVSVHQYYPFGREISSGAGETMKFTGHERDFAPYDYQDYMHARYDNPYLGRFLSVDPNFNLERVLVNPQAWNRYTYAESNPISSYDPDGRQSTRDLRCEWCTTPATQAAYRQGQTQALKIGAAIGATVLVARFAPPLARVLWSWALMNSNQATELADAVLSPPGSSALPSSLAEETLQQAAFRGTETIAGFAVDGTKGLVGSTFTRNILYLQAKSKGAVSIGGLLKAIETEAKAAGASRISIVGLKIINSRLFNADIAKRYGYTFTRINEETVQLTKVIQ